MIQGVDYSYSGPMTAAQAKANGVQFVCRYVSIPGQAKNLRRSEVVDFLGAGIGIVVVFESGQAGALGGYQQGVLDGQLADGQVKALGLTDCPVYFAVDFDAQPSQYPLVSAYLAGAGSVVGFERLGAYGGYYLICYLLDHALIRYAWQAIAWSNGRIDQRAHIFQSGGATIAGVDVDHDRTVSSDTDYGQFHPTSPSTTDWLLTMTEPTQQQQVVLDAQWAKIAAAVVTALTQGQSSEEFLNRVYYSGQAENNRKDTAGKSATADSESPVTSRVDAKDYPRNMFLSGMDQKSAGNAVALVAIAKQAAVDAKQAADNAAKSAAAVAELAVQLTDIVATLAAQDAATEAAAKAAAKAAGTD